MSEFRLPDVGEGLTEAEIVTWRVAVGDTVKVNDVIVDIETAKSIVELPSPYAGVVTALLVEEGNTVPVGTPIIAIGDREAADAFSSTATAGSIVEGETAPAPTEKEPERQAVLVGYGPRSGAPARRRKANVAPRDVEQTYPAPARALAKPPVRKLAKDLGIDLAEVPCDGPVVTRADVEAYAANRDGGSEGTLSLSKRPFAPPPQSGGRYPQLKDHDGDVRIPIKGVRKWTADAMVASAFTAPHVTEWITVDVSRTMELVTRLKADRAFSDVKVSPTLVVAKAVCLAMRRTPELNSQWDGDAQEIVLKGSVNLGIAAATDRGLVVPNIPGAQDKSLHELAEALDELTATARAGKTQPAQMSGGTFTITNIGVFGVDAGTPIINPGESGILSVGAIEKRPWVGDDDEIVARWVTTLALSFDHRVVDGEQGSRFLADVAAILRDPATALTY
ncbi:dihydrolipoamide acetyltransferase family protein [Aeromicrobium terrae]|uniref:Dihydrolipoamide acetyltransferase component of pyruvate dehydrogenase complex n=1 Tax=Aeromicrobium terrae TaxID=2498846 RepID=A0A5C8NG05_9ACTN|nr:dihydrolipoamide acetyltransferase family protein [Aeromicrobium terrae]TXL57689.1 2-oxo acid dehydrogenase subunit E2 [Aeromicrobium terrae]